MSNKNKKPLVSVVMITYKHEVFIKEAIEGVLMQECDFEMEFIIADDCSPDKTEEIVRSYIDDHPKGSCIKYKRHPENIGMIPNFIFALNEAKGDYIALCEGDDYWITKDKLKNQLNVLEKENAVLCHTSVRDSLGNSISTPINLNRNETESLLNRNFIITPSVLFNRIIIDHFNWMKAEYPFGDWPLWLTALTIGKITFLNQYTCIYRINDQGVWQNNWKDKIGSDRIYSEILMLEDFINTYPAHTKHTNNAIINRLLILANFHYTTGSYRLNLSRKFLFYAKKDRSLRKLLLKSLLAYTKYKISF